MFKNNQLLLFYFSTYFKRNIVQKVRFIIVIIPVFAIILLFSTIQDLPMINQKLYLYHCSYDKLTVSENYSDTSLSLFNADVLAEVSKGGNLFHLNLLYNPNNINLDKTIIPTKNLYKGRFEADSSKNTIVLSYNVAKNLNVAIGDKVTLMFNEINLDADSSYKNIECEIIGIVNSYSGNIMTNEYVDDFGLGYITLNDEDKNYVETNYKSRYLSFDTTENQDTDFTYTKQDQLSSVYVNKNYKYLVYTASFPSMAILLLFIAIKGEFSHLMKRNRKTYALFNILGLTKEQLHKICVFEYLSSLTLGVIIAEVCYKYLIMEYYIQRYVPFIVILVSMVICIAIGYFISKLYLKYVFHRMNVIELANGKE